MLEAAVAIKKSIRIRKQKAIRDSLTEKHLGNTVLVALFYGFISA
jgi:hypothetical protein